MDAKDVGIRMAGTALAGTLTVPEGATGIVLFAHGSGSSRHSPRNRYVARVLHERRLATLLMDLLTPEEEESERLTRHLRFDIGLLAERVVGATRWLDEDATTSRLRLGFFGASTGAAAALVAAAFLPERVAAVVSRGGRPDLAGPSLASVRAATLFIVGGEDKAVIEVNREALEQLRCEKQLAIVPGATHLFEERGTLERAASKASDWFVQHLGPRRAATEAPVR
jgi:putative phosphoribosyl transferase